MDAERITAIRGNIRIYDNRVAERDVAELLKEVEKLRRIVGCVVRTVDRMDYGLDTMVETVRQSELAGVDPDPLCGVTWGKVSHVCGLGSTSAITLCREFGVEPDHDCAKDEREMLV